MFNPPYEMPIFSLKKVSSIKMILVQSLYQYAPYTTSFFCYPKFKKFISFHLDYRFIFLWFEINLKPFFWSWKPALHISLLKVANHGYLHK